MKPKITSQLAWQQAEILMQPALIRLLDNIRNRLDKSIWQGTYQEISTPIPGYQLCLKYEGEQRYIDIWELCYQVCFINYQPTHGEMESMEVDIDTSLINEMGEVDWNRLDTKSRLIVEDFFANLPTFNQENNQSG
jgi:hypothetical protein